MKHEARSIMSRKFVFIICLAGALLFFVAPVQVLAQAAVSVVAPASASVNQNITITVGAWALETILNNRVVVELGDGNQEIIVCTPSGGVPGGDCNGSFTHSYGAIGDYVIRARICILPPLAPQQCFEDETSIQITPAAPPGCVTDGLCDWDCPTGCTVAEDPDCGCLGGDGCCGIDCDNNNDSDCPAAPPIADSYDNPLLSNNIVEFIWRTIIVLFTASLVVAPLMLIIGAYVLVTSGGLPSKIDRGKRIIIWTLIGFFIILIARGSVNLFFRILGG